MIIVTGPKGSGKTTLVNQLVAGLDIKLQKPFTNPQYYDAPRTLGRADFQMKKVEADNSDLMEAVTEDLYKWPETETSIYEGYPLIEEYIYGPLNRGGLARGFEGHAVKPVLEFFWRSVLVIYCRPADELIEDPALAYYDLMFRPPLSRADCIIYNYHNDKILGHVQGRVRLHHEKRMREYGLI
jgi:energy-coupling factor transporter ATP-binding protein EcfA2